MTAPALPTLRSLSFRLSKGRASRLGIAAGSLAPLASRAGAHVWIRHGRGFVGLGEVARFSATGPDRFQLLQRQFQAAAGTAAPPASSNPSEPANPSVPGIGTMAFAKIAYSKRSAVPSELLVPRVVVGHPEADFTDADGALASPWVTVTTADPAENLTEELGLAELERLASANEPDRTVSDDDAVLRGALTEDGWKAAVARAVEVIEQHEVTKVVMARDVTVSCASRISRAELTRRLLRAYDECWTYSVDGLIGATPEMLIRLLNGQAQARVLAGTLDRRASVNGAQAGEATIDDARREFLGSEKQINEHRLAIDSLVGQLSGFAPQLVHDSEPFVLELPNVWHLASDVSVLVHGPQGTPSVLDLCESVHPTAAVCGTPRIVASLLIKELEQMERGHYAGPVGWIDSRGNGEFGIALRGMTVTSETTARVFGGCGIVDGSIPEAELLESWAKMRPVLDAFGLSRPDTAL